LNISEIKEVIQKKYYEGQEVILWIVEGERGDPSPYKSKIITFNPNTVLVERMGCGEEAGNPKGYTA
jgi:hypothetical protein